MQTYSILDFRLCVKTERERKKRKNKEYLIK